MKKYVFLLLITIASNPLQAKPLKIATTFTIFADMAKQIGGQHIDVVSITKPGADIHNYQPTPKDIVKLQGADLILWHGLNLELWFDKFYHNVSEIPKVSLTKGIVPLSIDGGAYHGKPNPHAWMSSDNATIYIANILEALIVLAPEHAEDFNINAQRYEQKIKGLMAGFKKQLAQIPAHQRWLVSSEGAFSYLALELGLKELFIWPINADAQGSPKQIKHVIDQVRAHKIGAVFSESTVSDKPAKQVAREARSHYAGVLYVDSLSAPDGPVPNYLSLLSVTTQAIIDGLKVANRGHREAQDKGVSKGKVQ